MPAVVKNPEAKAKYLAETALELAAEDVAAGRAANGNRLVERVEADYLKRWECGRRLARKPCRASMRIGCFREHGVIGRYVNGKFVPEADV